MCNLIRPLKIYWLFLSVLLTLFLSLSSARVFAADAELLIHNRSGYPMVFAFWKNGKDCSEKVELGKNFDINAAQAQTLIVPADTLIAVGVAVFEIKDKLPLACDYILSFKLMPTTKYTLEYDVRDRHCYGQIYQSKNNVFQMIMPGEKEALTERIPVFGWDKFEPGCEEQ